MSTVEFVVLANHAEAVNGLLYISGGGWSEHWRVPLPDGSTPATNLGIGVSLLVPWGDTNRKHPVSIIVESEDGGDPIVRLDAEMEVGRPPGLPAGIDLRSCLAVNLPVMIPEEGGYRVVAQVGEGSGEGQRRSTSFRVHDQQLPPQFRTA